MAGAEEPKPFKWVGGHLSLDFNNTVDWKGLEPGAGEYLTDYGRLVAWGHEAGVLSERDRDALLRTWGEQPALGRRILEKAWSARTTMHRVFLGTITGTPDLGAELPAINALLYEAPGQLACEASGRSCEWVWSSCEDDAACMIWPVVRAASQLLTSPQLADVKTCANGRCGWLFLDTSRKHNRKWCEMGVCGNRAKARRYYDRRKRQAEGG
ncbi:MAG: CGNR zinc finger domain-containing protein [Gemmatimonadota bacterium]|nr:MAG: CGNR zinc finger domain-containing protein [Gemmatimonadota bacterium]